jgi:hypothetical protein
MVFLLTRAHDLPPADLRAAVAMLNARTTASDVIITGAPDESVPIAELFKGHADVLGLNDGPPLDSETVSALTEMARDHHRVWWIPSWLPPGQSSVELWLMRAGFRTEDHSAGKRRLVLYYFPPEPLAETATSTAFDGVIVLERVETLFRARSGSALPVALHWTATQPVANNYHIFVHLLDAGDNRVAQSDGQPALWTRPTSSWLPGEVIEDRRALSLGDDLSPGKYTLIAGLYLPENGERLATAGGETFVRLGNVQITRGDARGD